MISGVVRGKGLKADRLVHLQGYGDFQIEKVGQKPELWNFTLLKQVRFANTPIPHLPPKPWL